MVKEANNRHRRRVPLRDAEAAEGKERQCLFSCMIVSRFGRPSPSTRFEPAMWRRWSTFVDHPSSGPRGCVLELFNALGESIGVVTVPEDAVEPLRADEVLSVRPLAVAG
jgi:hypothetical protein